MKDLQDIFWWEENRKAITENESLVNGLRLFGYNIDKKARSPLSEHYHKDAIEITYVAQGMQVFEVGGEEYRVAGGEVFVTFKNEPHSTGTNPQGVCVQYWMQIELKNPVNFLGLSAPWDKAIYDGLSRCNTHFFKINKNYSHILDKAFFALAGNDPAQKARGHIMLLGFINEVLESQKRTENGYSQNINDAVKYIQQSVRKVITFEELSQISHLSVSRFKKKFNEQVGISPMAYHNLLKIEEAKRMLAENKKIIDITFELNFSSSSHFGYTFKKLTSMTPTEYKKYISQEKKENK